jgi:hypothetical protein
MNAEIAKLREYMFVAIGPHPRDCCSFAGRPILKRTAFFPGGVGLWESNDNPILPVGGVLFLGSDWGDVESFDKGGQDEAGGNNRTWDGLRKIVSLAKIPEDLLFCTNAWPCLRDGARAVGGAAPGSKDPEFTSRCKAFFLHTIELMRPKLVVPLGLLPTSFVASLSPGVSSPWGKARSWGKIDPTPVWRRGDLNVVPIVHPSMPNRHHRQNAKTIEAEAELIGSVRGERAT